MTREHAKTLHRSPQKWSSRDGTLTESQSQEFVAAKGDENQTIYLSISREMRSSESERQI